MRMHAWLHGGARADRSALVTPGDRQSRAKVRSGIQFAPALARLVVTP
jgi:hypothetical protein